VSVNAIGGDRRVLPEPLQVIRRAQRPRDPRRQQQPFVYVPHLGTDQIFQFVFDERSGRLASNTPPLVR